MPFENSIESPPWWPDVDAAARPRSPALPPDRIALIRAFRASDLVAPSSLALAMAAGAAGGFPTGLEALLHLRISVGGALVVALCAVLWHACFAACGLYAQRGSGRTTGEALRVAGASLVATVLLFTALSAPAAPNLTRATAFWVGASGLALALRAILRAAGASRARRSARRVIIVGSGPRGRALARWLAQPADAPTEVLGFVDTANPPSDAPTEAPLLGEVRQLERLLMRTGVDVVLLALPVKSCYAEVQEAIRICERMGVEAQYLADVFQCSHARPHFEHGPSHPLVALKVVPSDYRHGVKRLLDVAASAALLVALAPLFAAIALAVRLTTPGPAIFAQERLGLNRRRFRMLKFRTMVDGAESLQPSLEERNEVPGPVFKIRDDPRLTPVGRILRRTSLDELPQLINVLRGDMSLVGPRPLPVRDVHRFPDAWLMRRFSVPPGLTGLWQVSGRSELVFDKWMELDLSYIDGWSLELDLRILMRTIPAVVSGKGAL